MGPFCEEIRELLKDKLIKLSIPTSTAMDSSWSLTTQWMSQMNLRE